MNNLLPPHMPKIPMSPPPYMKPNISLSTPQMNPPFIRMSLSAYVYAGVAKFQAWAPFPTYQMS